MCVVITPKYRKTAKIFGILGVVAKTLYGYWSGNPCLVGVLAILIVLLKYLEKHKLVVVCTLKWCTEVEHRSDTLFSV